MSSLFGATLVKLALPTAVSAAILVITRIKGISWRDDLGLRQPLLGQLVGWLAFWVVWVLVDELVIRTFDLDQAKPWPSYTPVILALRILAIGLVGPFSEELVVRGVFFDRLRRTALGPYGAIALTAVAWAAMHYAYGAGSMALIAVDGIVLGLARHKGGSLWIPVVMHVSGNLFSIGQSLSS